MGKTAPSKKSIALEPVLKALSDPVRLSVVRQLLEADGGEIACGTFKHDLTKATFSHHIKILIDAGLIVKRQEGTRGMTSLRRKEIEENFPDLLKWIRREE